LCLEPVAAPWDCSRAAAEVWERNRGLAAAGRHMHQRSTDQSRERGVDDLRSVAAIEIIENGVVARNESGLKTRMSRSGVFLERESSGSGSNIPFHETALLYTFSTKHNKKIKWSGSILLTPGTKAKKQAESPLFWSVVYVDGYCTSHFHQ
jgi:hypothetical protein